MRAAVVFIVLLAGGVGAIVVSEAGPNGDIPEGTPATFHVIHMDDGLPAFHQDTDVRVTWNGTVLYETTPASGHEYDGIHTFTVVFPGPGPFVVASEGGSVRGNVTPARDVAPKLQWDHTTQGDYPSSRGDGTRLEYSMVEPVGAHTETFVTANDAKGTWLRTELHDHAEAHAMVLQPAAPTTVNTVHALFQATDKTFQPFLKSVEAPAWPPSPTPMVPAARPLNDRTVVNGDGIRLALTYDPFTTVGQGTMMHISAIAFDEEGEIMPHTDFAATLSNSFRIPWTSSSIHEHDGVWEIAYRASDAGPHELEVVATNGDATVVAVATYNVLPDAGPGDAYEVALESFTPIDGEPVWLNFSVAAMQPLRHGEAEVVITRGDVPMLLTKLHTHDDGLFQLRYAFTAPGPYLVQFNPYTLQGEPATFGGDREVTLEVESLPVAAITTETPWAAGLLAVGMGLVWRTRVRGSGKAR